MVEVTPGQPATPSDLRHAAELQQLQAGELEEVRVQAERWRTGLGGLVGLATIVAAVKVTSGTATLGVAGRIVVGVLLLLAVAVSAVGTFVAMRAAHGFPTRRLAEATLDELITRRAHRLRRACRDLRCAVVLAYLSLALMMGALAMTWFS